jgi:hypothetical protein
MLLNICTVFYLNQREVQAVFSRKAPDVQPAHSAGLSLRQEGPQA